MKRLLFLTLSIFSLAFIGCGDALDEAEEAAEDLAEDAEDYDTGDETGGDEGFTKPERQRAALHGQWVGPCVEFEDTGDGDDDDDDDDDSSESALTSDDDDDDDDDGSSFNYSRISRHFGKEHMVEVRTMFSDSTCLPEEAMASFELHYEFEVKDAVDEDTAGAKGSREVSFKVVGGRLIALHANVATGFNENEECGKSDWAAFEIAPGEKPGETNFITWEDCTEAGDSEDHEWPSVDDEWSMMVKVDKDKAWFGEEKVEDTTALASLRTTPLGQNSGMLPEGDGKLLFDMHLARLFQDLFPEESRNEKGPLDGDLDAADMPDPTGDDAAEEE